MPEEQPLFVIDVDWTIYDGTRPGRLRPGMDLLIGSLATIGEVRLWSAGGRDHCIEVAERFELTENITDYHRKPPYPPTEEGAIAVLGRKASLQIDDDPSERVADWNFIAVEPYTIDS